MKTINFLFDKPLKQYTIVSTIWVAVFGAWHDTTIVILSELLCLFIGFTIISVLWIISNLDKIKKLELLSKTNRNDDYKSIKENRDGLISEVEKLRNIISSQNSQIKNLSNLVHLIYVILTPNQTKQIIRAKSDIENILLSEDIGEK